MVVRENFGDRGLNYLIKKSNDREVELSTNLDSNLRLINFLLAKQTQAMDYFDDRATLELEKENIEELLERMEALHRMYEDTLDAHNE
jgi:RNA polymerase-binding transcription factor DksA